MIPIKDSAPRRLFPYVNVTLIMVNILVFIKQSTLGQTELISFINSYGTRPQFLLEQFELFRDGFQVDYLLQGGLPLITANFLHGGWLHLAGNMLYLWVFGDNVESYLGHLRYFFLYLLMGAGSQLFHVGVHPQSTIPLVGASGAIAGVLGAYLIFFPRARVLTLVPLGFFITFVYIPSVVFLAFWFILQLINASAQGAAMGVQPVAWWAHVGGFLIGLFAAFACRITFPHKKH